MVDPWGRDTADQNRQQRWDDNQKKRQGAVKVVQQELFPELVVKNEEAKPEKPVIEELPEVVPVRKARSFKRG